MKRWFRPLAYSIIVLLAALALFGEPESGDDYVAVAETVERAEERPSARTSVEHRDDAPTLKERPRAELSSGLFATTVAQDVDVEPEPEVESDVVTVAAVVAEPKVIGWMRMASEPYVFVEYEGAQHALAPGDDIDGAYRFDGVSDGYAEFEHLPTGQARLYPVSEPEAAEE